MSALENDKEYQEKLARERKDIDDYYLELIESAERSNEGLERLNGASEYWGRDDLAEPIEAIAYGKEAAVTMAASREANDSSSSFVTGEVIKGNFRRTSDGRDVEHQETLIAKAVRLDGQQWQQLVDGSDDQINDIAKQHFEDFSQDGFQNVLAFNPPVNVPGKPLVVIAGQDGNVESISSSAEKSEVSPEKKAGIAEALRKFEERYAGKDVRNGVFVDQPYPGYEDSRSKPNADAGIQSQQAEKSPSYSEPSPNFGHVGGNAWGGDKIAEHWKKHEDKQEVLKQRIDTAMERLEQLRAEGMDTTQQETTLQIAQNTFAIAEHEQAARSWNASASYARVSYIGGMSDMDSHSRASRMADYHRCKSEMLREKQMELKNPEIAAQRAQEAKELQDRIDESQRYFREIAENNRRIQEERGGPTTQEKIESLDRFLAGQDPQKPQQQAEQAAQQAQQQALAQAQQKQPEVEVKPVQAVEPTPQVQQAPAQAEAQQTQAAEPVQAEAQQPQVAEQTQQEPEQQAEVKAVDANADTGSDAAADEQQETQVKQAEPVLAEAPQVQVAEQASHEPEAQQNAEIAEHDPEQQKAEVKAAEPAAEEAQQSEVEAQQPEQPQAAEQVHQEPEQQAEVKAVDANADTGSDANTDEQQETQVQQTEPVQAEVQQAQVAEPAQQEPEQQQAEMKAVDANAETGSNQVSDEPKEAQVQQDAPVQAEAQQAQASEPVHQEPQAESKAVDANADASTSEPATEEQEKAEQQGVEAYQPEQPQAVEQGRQEPEQQAEMKTGDANAEAGSNQSTDEPKQGGQSQEANQQAQHKANIENAQGVSTARAQETGQAPQQVSAAPASSGDQVKGNEVQQMSQEQSSQQTNQSAAQDSGYDPHQRVRDMEAKGQAQIDQEKSQGTYEANDQASMNSLNEQGAQAQQASAEMAQAQEQKQGKTMSM